MILFPFHGNVSKYEAGLHHYLDTNLRAAPGYAENRPPKSKRRSASAIALLKRQGLVINVAKVQQKLAQKVINNGEHDNGIVGCVTLCQSNLLLNTTSRAHSVKHVKLANIARPPQKNHLKWLRGFYSKFKPSSL